MAPPRKSPGSPAPQKTAPKAGSTSTLTITALNEYGYGVGQKGGQTLTVARTAPGDLVQIGPPASAQRWTSAELLKVVKPGVERVDSGCRAFDHGCGGCQWLHLGYSAQLRWKEKNLGEILRKRAGYPGKIQPAAAMEKPAAYRNKLSLRNEKGKLVFLTEFDGHVVSPGECLVQTEALQKAWAVLRSWKAPGVIEQLHLRSNGRGEVGLHAFVRELSPAVRTILTELSGKMGALGAGATTRQGYSLVGGEPFLVQSFRGLEWPIPHNGFFQTNAVMAGTLLEKVVLAAKAKPADRVLDLYCGAGFFGLALASDCREVLGIEENPQSVAAAVQGAQRSGRTNTRFLAGDLGAVLAQVDRVPGEIAVVDPPREGLLHHAMDLLISRQPQRIVYVSCYPQSLVRDYKLLAKAGWKGIDCLPVDMFPHTSHLETVLVLER